MVLIGVGCSAIYMGAIYVFGRVNRPDRFALLCSWLLGIGTAGNLLAASPLAFAAETIGWRASMLILAALTAASCPVRRPAHSRSAAPVGARGNRFFAGIGEILATRALWPLLPLTAIGYSVILAERGLWAGPFFSEVYGLSPVERGNALLVMAAAMSAGAMIYGPLDKWFGTRKWVVAVGSAVTAACFLLLGTRASCR